MLFTYVWRIKVHIKNSLKSELVGYKLVNSYDLYLDIIESSPRLLDEPTQNKATVQ